MHAFVLLQTALYDAGKSALEKEFRSLLSTHSRPVPPVVILDVLAVEEGWILDLLTWLN